MASTALLTRALRSMGGRVVPFVPRRLKDGYDLSAAGVAAALAAGAAVVVTADCGTSAHASVARPDCCRDRRHHQRPPSAGRPIARLPGGAQPTTARLPLSRQGPGGGRGGVQAGAGARAPSGRERAARSSGSSISWRWRRSLTSHRSGERIGSSCGMGCGSWPKRRTSGCARWSASCGLDGKRSRQGGPASSWRPDSMRSAGSATAMRGVELLLTDDEAEAGRIARELDELNRQRQDLDRRMLVEAREMVGEAGSRRDLRDRAGRPDAGILG